ncbi:MAG TPA: hypothetical protein VJ861_12055 [Treponemataceae bacterium]|nr:hypothetical protein [Treponemataceae bacterium]
MKYSIHKLELHKTIRADSNASSDDGTLEILSFTSKVSKKDLEPAKEQHLSEGKKIDEIEAGFYLFTQGILPASIVTETLSHEAQQFYREAAEAVWLESLWREVEFKNDRILVRILSEDGKTVYQIFRELTL